jgi:predicted RNase H-like HicB family nuclease
MTDYAVIYEPAADGSWSARAADLPVYAVGDTRADAEREIRDAITVHLDELAESGKPVPLALALSAVGTVTV